LVRRLRRLPGNVRLEPRPRELPIAGDGLGIYFEDTGGFIDAEAAEIAEFDDLGGARVEFLKGSKGFIDYKNRVALVVNRKIEVVDNNALTARRPFLGVFVAEVVHEDTAHSPRSHHEEVLPIMPIDSGAANEPNERFVDEESGLEAIVAIFVRKDCAGKAVKLAVDRGSYDIGGMGVAFAHAAKPNGEIFRLVLQSHPTQFSLQGSRWVRVSAPASSSFILVSCPTHPTIFPSSTFAT